MKVVLTPTQEQLVKQALKEGRVASREDALRRGMAMWEHEELERRELLAMIAEADAEIERGEFIEISSRKELREFMNDVIERGKQRLAARKKNPSG